jgi:hypothetical protein
MGLLSKLIAEVIVLPVTVVKDVVKAVEREL